MTGFEQPGLMFTVMMFIAMIGPLVFVHELGHYLAGRVFGTRTDSFSIGFGREVAGWTDRRGVRWKLGWLPLGGYVRFAGDANAAGLPGDLSAVAPAERHQYFLFKPLWQRAIIILAGPLANFLIAIAIIAGFVLAYGKPTGAPIVSAVDAGSPAAAAGVRAGDELVAVDGRPIVSMGDVPMLIDGRLGESVAFTFIRDGRRVVLNIVPRMFEDTDPFGNVQRVVRIGISSDSFARTPAGPLEAVGYGCQNVVDTIGAIVTAVGQIVSGDRSMRELGGPLKIAKVSGQAGAVGAEFFIGLMAFVSINLGFINLLPIPTLDGGHLALYLAEAVRRKPVPPKVLDWAFMTGFMLLVSFMLLVTWNDLASFGVFEHVAGLIS
jgi:regulator of sigma E protease